MGKSPALALPRLLLVTLSLSAAAPASAGAAELLAPVESCVQRNLPERSSRHAVRFRTVDRTGSARTSSAGTVRGARASHHPADSSACRA